MSEYSYRKLRGRIVEKYGTITGFVSKIGLSKVAAANKLNGRSGFSQRDMAVWGDALEIPIEQYGEYFFT
ncbi:MAG: DUF739 family protein [Lachnospiraceae bacterium]|nr:DUF739 family protein [Lachnospiraceae bacterium]